MARRRRARRRSSRRSHGLSIGAMVGAVVTSLMARIFFPGSIVGSIISTVAVFGLLTRVGGPLKGLFGALLTISMVSLLFGRNGGGVPSLAAPTGAVSFLPQAPVNQV